MRSPLPDRLGYRAGPPSSIRASAVIVAVVVAMLAILPMASVADAHANLLAASPAPGQPAGGAIDRVQMVFDEPITELTAEIEGPDGELIRTSTDQITSQQYDLVFDPLDIEGIYRVRYTFVSNDADRVELGHAFEFDRSAPAPLPINGPGLIARSGGVRWPWVGVGVMGAGVVALSVRLWHRRRALARVAG